MSDDSMSKVGVFFAGMFAMFWPCFVMMHYTNYLGAHAVRVEACENGLGEFVARDGELVFTWKNLASK